MNKLLALVSVTALGYLAGCGGVSELTKQGGARSETALFTGGSSTPDRIEELETARAVVAQVECSPRAGVAAENIAQARKSLDTASRLAKGSGKLDEIRYEAFVATRNADIANRKILALEAQYAIDEGTEERQQIQIRPCAREAESAKESAQRLEAARAFILPLRSILRTVRESIHAADSCPTQSESYQ